MTAAIPLPDIDALIAAVETLGLYGGCAKVGASLASVDRHRKADAEFRGKIEDAMARSAKFSRKRYLNAMNKRRRRFTQDDWDTFFNLLATTPLQDIILMPGQPRKKHVLAQRRIDPAFAARYDEVMAGRRLEVPQHFGQRGRRVRRSPNEMSAFWSKYLELLATNTQTQIAAMPGMPCHKAFARRRRRDAAFDEAAAAVLASRSLKRLKLTADQVDSLVQAIGEVGVARACMRVDSPSSAWVYNRGFSDPTFGKRLSAARDHHRSQLLQRAAEHRKSLARERRAAAARDKVPIGEAFNRQLRQNDLYRLAATAASSSARYLQGDARDDLIADLVLGVLNEEYGAEDLKAQARKYQTAYYGALRDTSSMDVSRSADDTRTLHDQIGSWDYG